MSSSGVITVNGGNVSKAATFSSSTPQKEQTTSSGISPVELYEMIGVVEAIPVISSAVVVMRRRK